MSISGEGGTSVAPSFANGVEEGKRQQQVVIDRLHGDIDVLRARLARRDALVRTLLALLLDEEPEHA